jgi:hypothetical protein
MNIVSLAFRSVVMYLHCTSSDLTAAFRARSCTATKKEGKASTKRGVVILTQQKSNESGDDEGGRGAVDLLLCSGSNTTDSPL